MELCSPSNSHSAVDMNGKESETQLLVLDTREVCQEAAGDTRCTRQVAGSDTSFSAVEKLCLAFSWLELRLWQWKQGGKSADVWPETN